MLVALLILVGWPVAELFVALKVAEAIGVLETIVLLIAAWPLGLWTLRSQGRAAWTRFGAALSEHRPPAREAVDGVLVVVAGLLLMVPGFITDAVGLILLLAPTRALARPLLLRGVWARLIVRAAGSPRAGSHDVDSTATDIDQPRLAP